MNLFRKTDKHEECVVYLVLLMCTDIHKHPSPVWIDSTTLENQRLSNVPWPMFYQARWQFSSSETVDKSEGSIAGVERERRRNAGVRYRQKMPHRDKQGSGGNKQIIFQYQRWVKFRLSDGLFRGVVSFPVIHSFSDWGGGARTPWVQSARSCNDDDIYGSVMLPVFSPPR